MSQLYKRTAKVIKTCPRCRNHCGIAILKKSHNCPFSSCIERLCGCAALNAANRRSRMSMSKKRRIADGPSGSSLPMINLSQSFGSDDDDFEVIQYVDDNNNVSVLLSLVLVTFKFNLNNFNFKYMIRLIFVPEIFRINLRRQC